MANRKNKKSKGNKPKRVLSVVQRQVINNLDQKARDYARLIMDPCAAPLTHPVYPGGDAGFLIRCENFVTATGTATNQTGGVFHWVPGYINASDTELLYNGTIGTGAGNMVVLASAPGKNFLTANAKGVRCVAACVKATFPGAESTRSGRIHYGHTTAGTIDLGASFTVDNVAQLLQHYSRTPTDTIEVYWQPGIADTEFNDPTEAANAAIRDRKSAITIAVTGLPATVGITYHMTAIYEWTPVAAQGLSNNNMGKTVSRNSMDDVLDAIKRTGFTFVRNAAMGALNYATGGAVTGISNVFGLMPAVPRMRSRQLLLQ